MASIRELEPGKVLARVRIKGRPEVSKVFPDAHKAAAWAAAQEHSLRTGDFRDTRAAHRLLVRDLIDEYSRAIAPQLRSADTTALRLARFRRDLGMFTLETLTRARIAAWRDARLAEGAAAATVTRELGILSSVISYARKDLGVEIENAAGLVRRPPATRGRDRRLEPGEEARLLEALGDRAGEVKGAKRAGAYRVGTRNPWLRPLVQFAIETAMRQGEMLALVWEHVDLEERTAHLEDTKNGEARTVPLSSRAVAVLEALPRSPDGRVFPISAQAVKLAWGRACRRAGLEDLHFHDLRHEAASRLAEKLPNLIELAAVTGHKDLRMLKRYYHPRATDLAKKLG
ncbi:MAG: site-specific integrase [Metallibacterium scheffleri]|jgi:integrase|uniref:site-specific integrase n=1 Tax=Metallibacterium scheffleri TaxID=993689 RepID=UPI0026F10149|nr:site-specific integrase [Metallibacterium scheffleri]MCK9367423.1 site-specific integrase [Metallibacterium scheffleri]